MGIPLIKIPYRKPFGNSQEKPNRNRCLSDNNSIVFSIFLSTASF